MKTTQTKLFLNYSFNQISIEEVRKLIQAKGDLNKVDSYGRTPLMLAAIKGDAQIVELLLNNGADKNCTDSSGNTAIYHAICSGKSEDVVMILLKHKVDLNIANKLGRTVVHQSVILNNYGLLQQFIKSEANLNIQDSDGNTPLHLAANKGLDLIIKVLVAHGADFTIKNNEGKTPYGLAGPQSKKLMDVYCETITDERKEAVEIAKKMLHYFHSRSYKGSLCKLAILPSDIIINYIMVKGDKNIALASESVTEICKVIKDITGNPEQPRPAFKDILKNFAPQVSHRAALTERRMKIHERAPFH